MGAARSVDLGAAAGEPIDNSIEAKASVVKIQLSYSKDRKHVDSIAFEFIVLATH